MTYINCCDGEDAKITIHVEKNCLLKQINPIQIHTY